MRKRAAIDILQLSTNGHSMRDTAGTNSSPGRELAKKMRGRFPFHRRIGCKNQLPHDPFIENRFQLTDPELLRADSIERRQVPHQDEISAPVTS